MILRKERAFVTRQDQKEPTRWVFGVAMLVFSFYIIFLLQAPVSEKWFGDLSSQTKILKRSQNKVGTQLWFQIFNEATALYQFLFSIMGRDC